MAKFDHNLLCGWGGRKLAIEANARLGIKPIAHYGLPKATESRKLWDFAKKVTGDHLPNYRQEIGDCVSFGAKNAVQYLTCVQIAQGGRLEYHHVFPPWIYGTSRHDIGGDRLGNSDGSLGSWAAEAVRTLGILFADDEGVPPYGGRVASQWGSRSGPPREFYAVAKDNPVKTTAKVSNFNEAAAALSNGYPVTIASDVGFAGNNMQGRVSNGKCMESASGSWGHQMVLIGVDMSDRTVFVLNSWGSDLWSNQPDGAPPGGFWINERDANRILGQDDSWAFSQFDGFPAQKLDHLLL